MAIAFGVGLASPFPARPVGVIALSRKTSLGQQVLGLLDTYEVALSTSPGTSMSVEGAPWGSGGPVRTPSTRSLGQVIPSGILIQGLQDFN